jgi:hypothetical protein
VASEPKGSMPTHEQWPIHGDLDVVFAYLPVVRSTPAHDRGDVCPGDRCH